jgi:hypothetical protein
MIFVVIHSQLLKQLIGEAPSRNEAEIGNVV